MKKLFVSLVAMLCLLPSFVHSQDMVDIETPVDFKYDQLEDLIYANLRYPDVARQAGLSGTVKVKFSVAPNGKILNLVAIYPSSNGSIDPSIKQYTVVANGSAQIDETLKDQAKRALQAESLMVLNRIQKLTPTRVGDQDVLSSREVVFHYKLI